MLTNVSAVNSNVNFSSSLYDNFFKRLPNKDISDAAQFNKVGKALASPHYNRLALGIGAITTQPAIDRFNPNVDKDTAKASAYRTLAKILACTTVGFCVRGFCYNLTEKYAHASKEEGSVILTPKAILNEINPEIRKNKLKLHKNAFSTISALVVMTALTNYLLDAPLTTLLSNYFIKHDKTLNKSQEAV